MARMPPPCHKPSRFASYIIYGNALAPPHHVAFRPSENVGVLIDPFRSSMPSPPIPLFTLRCVPRGTQRKTRGRVVRYSFLVRIFHPLLPAGLSRRTRPSNPEVSLTLSVSLANVHTNKISCKERRRGDPHAPKPDRCREPPRAINECTAKSHYSALAEGVWLKIRLSFDPSSRIRVITFPPFSCE